MENRGRLLKVRKDDPRYLEEDDALSEGREPRYPHRKPSKAALQRYGATAVVAGSPVGKILATPEAQKYAGALAVAAAPKVARSVVKLGKTLTKAVAAQRIAVGGSVLSGAASAGVVGLLAAAGIGSYFSAKYIIDRFLSKSARLDAALAALNKARRDLRAKLGRELTKEENRVLYDHYKSVVDAINRSKVANFFG